jgi:hypothetical protein
MKLIRYLTLAAMASMALSPMFAQADPVVAQVCGATGCAPIPPVLAVAVIAAPVVIKNVQAAGNESGAGAQALRATLGISVRDIGRYGLFGGPNSFVRCPSGGC